MISLLAVLIKKDELQIPDPNLDKDLLTSVLEIVFGVIAVVAVIFIIISAIRYQTTIGDPAATSKLRNTIIYAAIGLTVALSAEAIIQFVIVKI
ncbi:MAG TPA: hypothetical protein VLG25_02240 [Patescibacteria group bacterium]|nr:hypothetical protein [Patescibacteria group bacterium]